MNEKQKEVNTFQQLEDASSEKEVKTATPVGPGILTPKEEVKAEPEKVDTAAKVEVSDFSDTAVGDNVNYIRPNLNNTEDIIENFQVFAPDTSVEPMETMAGNSYFWKVEIQLHYASKNEDDVQNKEYISGARAYKQKDGSTSDVQFWYDGAKTQIAYLWETVAKAFNVEPKDLSPQEFYDFLKSKPKVEIVGKVYDNPFAKKGMPNSVTKNMPESFTKA